MESGKLFTEILLDNKPLSECELVYECNHRHYRLYVSRGDNCFYALAVEFHSCEADGDIWECPALEVDPLFNVTAYFDGVRHLEFNRESDMAGYIYYPNMQGIVELFTKIRELELEICRDCDK
jgi:hypothetical protein